MIEIASEIYGVIKEGGSMRILGHFTQISYSYFVSITIANYEILHEVKLEYF